MTATPSSALSVPSRAFYRVEGLQIGKYRILPWRCANSYRTIHHRAKALGYKVVTRQITDDGGKKCIWVGRVS
jgi:hypothetical protein